MKPLHARYPFLRSAREAVEAADVDLGEVVATDDAVVDRAVERVEGAITEGDVGESHRRTRVELLSYPVARVLVSLVDEHVCTRKYARAEAATARERFTEEFTVTDDLSYGDSESLDLRTLLSEFDLADAVGETPDGYRVAVGTYLDLAADQRGDEWRLVNRQLTGGEVPVTADELHTLLKQAVRHRIEDGLPFPVPEAVAAELDEEVARLREVLAELDLTRDIDTVVPDLFPPCMKALLDRVQKGEHLEHHSRFAIAAFLAGIGMTTDEIVELFQVNPGFGEEATRYQVNHIRGDTSPTEYSTPACATMQSYGDCVNMDDRCERISHPMAYYEGAIDDADDDELEDWREAQDD
ncbi:DNA primase regulatory subunit PriL [Halomicrobium salinisoli]|uniref:DNA primase regulatory subunit PriL n=1 Tax=Halomicrobium salinisoli TaxID=2878391 RepID=UPI001CF0751E|nr:DNA primase regulatory subunit PriL [Halomicrobium salinisoli]